MPKGPPFILFGTAHLWAIGLTVLVPLVLALMSRVAKSEALVRIVRWAFAAWLIGTYILWYWVIFSNGWQSARTLLPMHLCDWATILAIVTCLRPKQRTYELAYFWGLAGTLQALVTPDLEYNFPDLRFIVFFAFHGGVIAAVFYLTLGAKMRPYLASIPRVLAWCVVYLAAAGTVDWLFKVNFGFLREKPPTGSLLDLMGPWPWYIGALMVLGIVFIGILYLPFWIADRATRGGSAPEPRRA